MKSFLPGSSTPTLAGMVLTAPLLLGCLPTTKDFSPFVGTPEEVSDYTKVADNADQVLWLQSNIEGTRFFIDGKEVGKSSQLKVLVSRKSYTIRAQAPEFKSKEEFIQPPYNRNAPISFTLLKRDRAPVIAAYESPSRKVYSRGGQFGAPRVSSGSRNTWKYAKKHAIVIAVSDYQSLVSPNEAHIPGTMVDLKYAEHDGRDIIDFLKNDERSGGDWRIHSLIGPVASTSNVKQTVADVLSNARAEDLIYIFFSGHARSSPTDPSEVYLLTQDFVDDDGYSGVDYGWIRRKIADSSARNIIAFIDACRSGTVGFARGSGRPDHDLLGEIQGLMGSKVVFTSGTGAQLAYEDEALKNGVFTYYLLKGLQGEAENTDNDAFVDLEELEEYVIERVNDFTRKHKNMNRQKPRLWEHEGLVPLEFPVSLRL